MNNIYNDEKLLNLVNNCLSNYSYDIAKLVFYLYKNEYENLQTKFNDEIRLKCAKYKIDYFLSDINRGYENVLKSYLIKRSKLY